MAGDEKKKIEPRDIIGKIVHYVSRNPEGTLRAAIVTGFALDKKGEPLLDGTIFVNEAKEGHEYVERAFACATFDGSDDPAPGTWDWTPFDFENN